jgi:hypothetical protein
MVEKIRYRIIFFLYGIFDYCPHHGWFNQMMKFRMNTSYLNDERNWGFGCKNCQKESYDHYEELWKDYWGSRF